MNDFNNITTQVSKMNLPSQPTLQVTAVGTMRDGCQIRATIEYPDAGTMAAVVEATTAVLVQLNHMARQFGYDVKAAPPRMVAMPPA